MFHRSARLFLRPPFEEDVRELTAAIADKAIVRNLARVPWPYTEDDARAWMGAPRDSRFPSLLITMPGEPSRIVGGCGLHESDDGAEIGYWIARDYWGKGIATEAASGLLQLATALGHSQIIARHAVDNPASSSVLGKLGFEPTGMHSMFFSLGRGEEVRSREYVLELESRELAAQAA